MSRKAKFHVVDFVSSETGEVLETARIPMPLWSRVIERATKLGITPETFLKNTLLELGRAAR